MSEYKFFETILSPYRSVFISIGRRKSDYWDLTDAQLAEKHPEEKKRIYAYYFPVVPCDLIPEPDNPDNPNAIKVLMDGKHVGYVPDSLCADVLTILKRPHEIHAKIDGGPHKTVFSGDVRHYDDPFSVRITIQYDGAPPAVTRSGARRGGKANVPVILQWIAAGLLLIFGLAMLPHFASVLFILAAVLAAPVRPLRDLLARYHIRSWMIWIAAGVLTVLAFIVAPGSAS